MRLSRITLPALAIALAGCAADKPAFFEPAQSAGTAAAADAAPTASSVTPGSARLAFEVPFLSGTPLTTAADGNLGSGCSGLPGAGDPMPDGLWAASIDSRGAQLTLDIVCVSPAGVTDSSDRTRVNPASPALQVVESAGGGASQLVPDVAAWLSSPPSAALYWVAINGGQITSVEQVAP